MAAAAPVYRPYLYILLLVKASLHFLATVSGYGLHRDEYLYLAEGSHPLWGYMEGPPVIGWVAGISTGLLGSSLWAAKLPVLLVGLLSIWLILVLVRELGGGKYAQLLAGAAWLMSPIFLGSNHLFQPVSFNQFCWLLVTLAWVRVINRQRPLDWYLLGAAAGIGLMTKYSIGFFLLALLVAILCTPRRKWLLRKEAWLAGGIALLLWLPNLWWQYHYGFPVVDHMQELAATQLVNMTLKDFLLPQLLFHLGSTLIWLPGLYFLLSNDGMKPYRSLGLAYLLVLLVLILFSGKAYYTYGAYAMLMAAGGVFWERKMTTRSVYLLPVLLLNLVIIPYALPVLPVKKMQNYGVYMRDHHGLQAPLRWEDGSFRELSQDYADMHGWEEMVATVAKFYHSLSPGEQEGCMIYAGNYGQAGALTFYREKYDLPAVHSFSASFLLWEPTDVTFTTQIAIEDAPDPVSPYFNGNRLIDSSRIDFARERHYVYYRSEPTENLSPVWRNILLRLRASRLGR